MATVEVRQCDLCGGMDGVLEVTIHPYGVEAWRIDMCDSCQARVRPATARGPRRKAVMKKVKLPPQPR